jgi:CRP-like cAMP-binding protein
MSGVTKMIKGHDLFRSLSFEEVERLANFSGSKSMEEGEYVFRCGKPCSHFFVVLEGKVNLKLPSSDSESSLVVGRMEKGDIFGFSALLGSERYTTTAQCTGPGTVLAVEVKPFRKLLDENSSVGLRAMSVVASAYFTRYIETLRRFQGILDEVTR